MGKILCATRGGEESIKTQDAAIARAHTTGDELVFLYIYDVEFLAHANYALRSDVVSEEMDRMAEFLMRMATERAQKKGVNAQYVIRHGEFDAELTAVMQEESATLLVLGRPGKEDSLFALEHLENLASEMQAKTGVTTCILPE